MYWQSAKIYPFMYVYNEPAAEHQSGLDVFQQAVLNLYGKKHHGTANCRHAFETLRGIGLSNAKANYV